MSRPTRRTPNPQDYIGFVMSMKPVFYVPLGTAGPIELVRSAVATVAATAPKLVPGPTGHGAARFSASTSDGDSYTIATATSYHPGDTFSVMCWANQLGNGNLYPGMLQSSANNDFGLGCTQAGSFNLGKTGVQNVFVTTQTFKNTGWHHVLCTKTGSTVAYYVDGRPATGTLTNATIVAGSGNWVIGGPSSGALGHADDFDGMASDVAIWNRVLTPHEAWRLFAHGFGMQ